MLGLKLNHVSKRGPCSVCEAVVVASDNGLCYGTNVACMILH